MQSYFNIVKLRNLSIINKDAIDFPFIGLNENNVTKY